MVDPVDCNRSVRPSRQTFENLALLWTATVPKHMIVPHVEYCSKFWWPWQLETAHIQPICKAIFSPSLYILFFVRNYQLIFRWHSLSARERSYFIWLEERISSVVHFCFVFGRALWCVRNNGWEKEVKEKTLCGYFGTFFSTPSFFSFPLHHSSV